jgi:hypothetical protein
MLEYVAKEMMNRGWLPPDEAERVKLESELFREAVKVGCERLQFGGKLRDMNLLPFGRSVLIDGIPAMGEETLKMRDKITALEKELAAAKSATSEEARAVLDHVANFDDYQIMRLFDTFSVLHAKAKAYRASLNREPAAPVGKTENLTYEEAKAAWKSGKWVVPMRSEGLPETVIEGQAVQVSKSHVWAGHSENITWAPSHAPFRIVTLTPEQQAVFDKWKATQDAPKSGLVRLGDLNVEDKFYVDGLAKPFRVYTKSAGAVRVVDCDGWIESALPTKLVRPIAKETPQ